MENLKKNLRFLKKFPLRKLQSSNVSSFTELRNNFYSGFILNTVLHLHQSDKEGEILFHTTFLKLRRNSKTSLSVRELEQTCYSLLTSPVSPL